MSAASEVSRRRLDVSKVFGGRGSVNGRVWMSSVQSIVKEKPPSENNFLLAINKRLIHIIERHDSRMQVIMDDAQVKRRGVRKSVGRWGEIGY